jgi:hypothetical protein
MTAPNRHAYSRLETDEELMARISAKRRHPISTRPGCSADERAAEFGLERRLVWVTA